MATRRGFAVDAIVGLAVALTVGLLTPSIASAHAEPDRSNPPIDGVVRVSPERLDVWFTQELFKREGENSLEVADASGTRVDDGTVVVDDADRTRMSVGLVEDLAPGEYTVAWRTLSATDGDPAEGTFTFTVDPSAPEATASAPPAETPAAATPVPPAASREEAAFPWWAVIAGAGILAAGAAAAWALRLEPPR